MPYYGNPHQPGTPQWSSRQAANEYRSRREEQRQRDAQIWAQRRRRAGGQRASAGLWILLIIVAVVALVIILSNIP
jgi:Flp pilus assembly protein TadB